MTTTPKKDPLLFSDTSLRLHHSRVGGTTALSDAPHSGTNNTLTNNNNNSSASLTTNNKCSSGALIKSEPLDMKLSSTDAPNCQQQSQPSGLNKYPVPGNNSQSNTMPLHPTKQFVDRFESSYHHLNHHSHYQQPRTEDGILLSPGSSSGSPSGGGNNNGDIHSLHHGHPSAFSVDSLVTSRVAANSSPTGSTNSTPMDQHSSFSRHSPTSYASPYCNSNSNPNGNNNGSQYNMGQEDSSSNSSPAAAAAAVLAMTMSVENQYHPHHGHAHHHHAHIHAHRSGWYGNSGGNHVVTNGDPGDHGNNNGGVTSSLFDFSMGGESIPFVTNRNMYAARSYYECTTGHKY